MDRCVQGIEAGRKGPHQSVKLLPLALLRDVGLPGNGLGQLGLELGSDLGLGLPGRGLEQG